MAIQLKAEYVGHRATVHLDGNLYLARDLKVEEPSGRVRFYPQHAIVREFWVSNGKQEKFVWEGHSEGGQMQPLIEDYALIGDKIGPGVEQ